jgi:hypothetical protein
MSEYLPDLILHIEDEPDFITSFYGYMEDFDMLKALYGSNPRIVRSQISDELDRGGLEAEIRRLFSEVIKGGPVVVAVASGQVARTFLESYVPGAVISDSEFHMNGKKTVEWLIAHGFTDYPLIGLSGTLLKDLDQNVKEFFASTNARYFSKSNWYGEVGSIVNQIRMSRIYTSQIYGHSP